MDVFNDTIKDTTVYWRVQQLNGQCYDSLTGTLWLVSPPVIRAWATSLTEMPVFLCSPACNRIGIQLFVYRLDRVSITYISSFKSPHKRVYYLPCIHMAVSP